MPHLVFIPFSSGYHSEFVNSSNQWNSTSVNLRKGTKYDLVPYNGQKHLLLIKAGDGDTIYVRGHGGQGGENLSTNMKVGDESQLSEAVKIEDVCQRLIDSGLPKSFGGKIKFSNCWSGVPDLTKTNAEKRKPLAQKAAEYLRGKGYKRCHVYGYLGPFGSEIEPPTSTDKDVVDAAFKGPFHHKNVKVPGKDRGERPNDPNVILRARDARVEFLPPKKSDGAVEFVKPGTFF